MRENIGENHSICIRGQQRSIATTECRIIGHIRPAHKHYWAPIVNTGNYRVIRAFRTTDQKVGSSNLFERTGCGQVVGGAGADAGRAQPHRGSQSALDTPGQPGRKLPIEEQVPAVEVERDEYEIIAPSAAKTWGLFISALSATGPKSYWSTSGPGT